MSYLLLKLSVIEQFTETMFQKFYKFNGSNIFYKMCENFPFMHVSVRMCETWKVCNMCPHHILIW